MSSIALPRIAAVSAFLSFALVAGNVRAEAINGAIYTSTGDHSAVNANQYPSKPDVYLNGGPSNFPQCTGGKLDDGIYFFQVTDPSGQPLLSSDGILNRKFQVVNGRIAVNLGTHANGGVSPCGSLAIQLFPYDDTPNGGGVYKVWITRVSDFEAACGVGVDCGLAGFVPGSTKTDNFKVGPTTTTPPTGSVRAFKFYDADANGQFDQNIDILLDGWKMTLGSFEQGIDSTHYTANGYALWNNLLPGIDYTVEEGTPTQGNWVHSATIYVGKPDTSPENPAGPLTVVAGQTTDVLFGNYCTIPSNGRTLGFWSNKNGQALIGDDDIQALIALNLRNANGSHFDPASKAEFRTWLLNGNAVNMAYMLSVQLAAMKLNVYNGFVNGGGTYVPAGMTVNALIAAADAALAADGTTFDGDANRAYQESLKNWLDELNNGAGLLSPTPCAYSFP